MSLEVHVIDAAGTNLTLGKIRLGTVGLVTAAEQGTMAQATIDIPDKGGTIRLAGLKRIWAYEPDSPVNWQTFWIGFLGDRQIHRGDGDLLIGSDRVITANVFDLNELLNDVIIKGAADATHGVRPAETDLERIAWLLQATPSWFPTAGGVAEVHDLGFVATTGGVAMDACDYRGQTPQSVLQDCADNSGRNWFVYYDETVDQYGLWYDKPESANYVCTLSFSNVDGDADGDTIWPMNPAPSPTQVQDPAKIISGLRAVYEGGEVFRQDTDVGLTTRSDFYIREQTAPSANTKSATKASAMADRMLRDNDEEEVSASFAALLPSTHVGLVRAGMRVSCRFEHFDPPYRYWTDWRILRLTTAQDEPNPGWYNVSLELSPIKPPLALFATLQANQSQCGSGEGIDPSTPYSVGWNFTGDAHGSGYGAAPKWGPVDYVSFPAPYGNCQYVGFELTEDATVNLYQYGSFLGVAGSPAATITVTFYQNATALDSSTWTDPSPGGLHSSGGNLSFWQSGIVGHAGDVFYCVWEWTNWVSYPYYRNNPGTADCVFSIWT